MRRGSVNVLLAASSMIVSLALLEARTLELSPTRLATLNLLVLPWALPIFVFAARRLRRVEPAAEGLAAGFLLYALPGFAVELQDRWGVFSLRPTALAVDGLLLAATLFAFFALRAGFARLVRLVPEPLHRPISILTSVGLVIIIALGFLPQASEHASRPTASRNDPNILLISIETLRADHLSAYGYRVHQTRNLDRIGAEGIRFDSAYAPAPWTLATLSSMMTGFYPSVFGIDHHHGLPEGVPTVASRLAAVGYTTHAVVTNVFLAHAFGLDAGFDDYEHLNNIGAFDDLEAATLYHFLQKVGLKILGNDASRVTNRAIAWLERSGATSSPFFLWLHYYDPHQPYGGEHIRNDLPCGSKEAPEIGYFFADARAVLHHQRTLTKPQQEHLVHLYDAEIRFLDRELGRLFEFIDRSGLGQNTLLVVTADHGEEFWDHGGFEHGHSLHEEVTRVPLMIRWPGHLQAGQVASEPVSLIDLPPTLLHAANLPLPENQGSPLPGFGADHPPRSVLSENILYGTEQKAARDSHLAVILSVQDQTSSVYDRQSDRTEARPLEPARGQSLLEFLRAQIDRNLALHERFGRETKVHLTRFELEQLRSLGYVE